MSMTTEDVFWLSLTLRIYILLSRELLFSSFWICISETNKIMFTNVKLTLFKMSIFARYFDGIYSESKINLKNAGCINTFVRIFCITFVRTCW